MIKYNEALQMIIEQNKNITLQARYAGKTIFQSKGKWLYPIFDLEDYLGKNPIDTELVEVHDKVIGKAAAMLFLHLGIGNIYGEVMSELAVQILRNAGVTYSYGQLVKRIDCKTEELLFEIDDLENAYDILCKRANRC